MNQIALLAGLLRSSLKKQIGVALVSMAVVLSLPFIAVLSLGEDVLAFLDSVPSVAAAELVGFYTGGPVAGNTYEWGNCTYWVFAQRLWIARPIPTTWGNANTWDERARRDGYTVNITPAVGAIMQSDAGKWGHVAFVTSVDALTGEWSISEMNIKGLNIVSTRTFPAGAAQFYDFIHGQEGASAWTAQL